MSSVRKSDLRMTAEEYARWELEQTVRHEFYEGEVFAQAGGTRRHSLIGSNAVRAVGNKLVGHPCQVHGSDMRVHIEATGYQAYPDVSVVCPPFNDDSEHVVANPTLIVEVLSPSTADFDRGTKFTHYRQIPSLQEYLIVWQDEPRIEQHTKSENGLWVLRDVVGINEKIELQCLSQSISLTEIYDKVDFDSDEKLSAE